MNYLPKYQLEKLSFKKNWQKYVNFNVFYEKLVEYTVYVDQ